MQELGGGEGAGLTFNLKIGESVANIIIISVLENKN